MRDLYEVLDNALGSRECEDCRFFVKRKEYCDVPQHQGDYYETECDLAERGDDPKECPVVLGYIEDSQNEYEKAKERILDYIDPYDEQLAKHLTALLTEEDILQAAYVLRDYLMKIATEVAEENT